MILSALGILFVVDAHLGVPISFFTSVFPYGSFFMPMFAFISDYFFSEKHIHSWRAIYSLAWNKGKKLLLPYSGWIVFYGVLTWILRRLDLLEIGNISAIDLIQNIITGGTSFFFNDPAWFVPLLYCVILSYAVIRKFLGSKWNDEAAMVVFACFGAFAIYLSQTSFHTHNTFMLMKIPCFLQYYHLAVLFRNKLEKAFDNASTVQVCSVSVIVNILLLGVFDNYIDFPMYATMTGFTHKAYFLPLISSVSGIAFWLKISKALVPVLGHNRLVNFISDHTAFIMTHHLAVKHLFIGILLVARDLGMTCFSGINTAEYRMYASYVYNEHTWCSAACFFFTMAVLLLSCSALCRIQASVKHILSVRCQ